MLECQVEIRVEWGHCDPAQIVYNPNFFDWMEHGLSRLFEAGGFGFGELIDRQPELRGTPLVRSEANFVAPARLGDVITLSSTVSRWGGSSFDVTHEFRCGDVKLVSAVQTRVWAGADEAGALKALPIPEDVRAALSETRSVRYHAACDDGRATD